MQFRVFVFACDAPAFSGLGSFILPIVYRQQVLIFFSFCLQIAEDISSSVLSTGKSTVCSHGRDHRPFNPPSLRHNCGPDSVLVCSVTCSLSCNTSLYFTSSIILFKASVSTPFAKRKHFRMNSTWSLLQPLSSAIVKAGIGNTQINGHSYILISLYIYFKKWWVGFGLQAILCQHILLFNVVPYLKMVKVNWSFLYVESVNGNRGLGFSLSQNHHQLPLFNCCFNISCCTIY